MGSSTATVVVGQYPAGLLGQFTRGYVDCALWLAMDRDCEPLEAAVVGELAPEAWVEMLADCAAFWEQHWQDMVDGPCTESRGGHDFYLTRNRHGAGFWDGDWSQDVGRRLTAAAHVWGSYGLYQLCDGLLYGHG